jgi:hypothetical protein
MSQTRFADLLAASDISLGEAVLGLCCLLVTVGFGVTLVLLFSEPLDGDPPRTKKIARALFAGGAFVMCLVASATTLPREAAKREAEVARLCGSVFTDVESGALAEITTWNQRLVERNCDVDAFVRAANAPGAKLRLH